MSNLPIGNLRMVGALVLALLVTPVLAQCAEDPAAGLPACSPRSPYFCVDAGYFLRGDSHMLEVYLSICNDGLQFVKSGQRYQASADISVVLMDEKGRQVAGDTYRIRLRTSKYQETTYPDSCKVRVLAFKARPGEFKMIVHVYDRDSRGTSTVQP